MRGRLHGHSKAEILLLEEDAFDSQAKQAKGTFKGSRSHAFLKLTKCCLKTMLHFNLPLFVMIVIDTVSRLTFKRDCRGGLAAQLPREQLMIGSNHHRSKSGREQITKRTKLRNDERLPRKRDSPCLCSYQKARFTIQPHPTLYQ